MTFLARSGVSKLVELRPACSSVRVGNVGLYDEQLGVWKAVGDAVGPMTPLRAGLVRQSGRRPS
jgi:hypothetical protein